jgi:predicted dinucleotide-binding enzyme
VPDAVADLPLFEGRIVVDATNQFASPPPNPKIADLGELTGSEYVASLLPGARVVKAFNTLYGQYIAADPRHEAGRQVLFLAGDDADAKTTVKDLTAGFGFAPVDLGSLREGGRLMQLGGPLFGLHVLKQD